MKQILRTLLASVFCAFASFAYTHSITAQTSVTITNNQHQLNTHEIGIQCFNGSGTLVRTTEYSRSINATTFEVVLTFNSSFTGSCQLLYVPYSDTTGSNDFKVSTSYDNGTPKLTVCSTCSTTAPARRTHSGKRYLMRGDSVLTLTNYSGSTVTVRVYLKDNQIFFGVSVPSTDVAASVAGGNVVISYDVQSVPSDALGLGEVNLLSTNLWQNVNDLRPTGWQ